MNRTIVVLLLGLAIGSSRGQNTFGGNWMQGLFDNINQLTTTIQGDVQQLTKRIQDDVGVYLSDIDRLNGQISQKFGNIGEQIKTLSNKTGSTIFINNGVSGYSRMVLSSQKSNGEPIYRDIEERIVDGTLYHTEKFYNSSSRLTNEHKYTLDLKTPGAKPVAV